MSVISDKYIYVHIYKTAGNSVRYGMNNLNDEEVGGVHCNAADTRQALLNARREHVWTDKFKFSFVRDPYAWNLSLYQYIKRAHGHGLNKICKEKDFDYWLSYLTNELFKQDRPMTSNKYQTQTDFLYHKGECLMDYVGRVERIDQDMNEICTRLGIRVPKLPVRNKTRRDNEVMYYYSRKGKVIIEQSFEDDFINFGYEPEQ